MKMQKQVMQMMVSGLLVAVTLLQPVWADNKPAANAKALSQAIPKPVPADESAAADDDEYRIGNLDLLEIKVWGADEITRSVRVDSKGLINLPLIGMLPAAGLTGYELETMITKELAKDYLQNPQVSVFIKEYKSSTVTVQGVVKKSGIYDFQGRPTLLDAISMAGGVDLKGDETSVKVVSKAINKSSHTAMYDLSAIRQNKIANPLLKGGDVVVVEELLPITVEGAVMKAGIFYMPGQPTLMQAISQAGGLHDIADSSSITVISSLNQKKSMIQYDMSKIRDGKINDPLLLQGDVVVVEKSAARNALNLFTNTLRGFVNFGNVFQ
jgi:polysaccharide export outer membrane protein